MEKLEVPPSPFKFRKKGPLSKSGMSSPQVDSKRSKHK